MTNPEIIAAFEALGGEATMGQLYDKLQTIYSHKNNLHDLLGTMYRRGEITRAFTSGHSGTYHKRQFVYKLAK